MPVESTMSVNMTVRVSTRLDAASVAVMDPMMMVRPILSNSR